MHVKDLNKGYRETITTAVEGVTNALVNEFRNRKKKPKDRDMPIYRHLETRVEGYLLGVERAISIITENSNLSQWARKQALKDIDLEKELSYNSVIRKAKLKLELEK
tara:strand:- start:140 stop:460 length:321 start_codon:yes stop_codon:yes gene_type:complete